MSYHSFECDVCRKDVEEHYQDPGTQHSICSDCYRKWQETRRCDTCNVEFRSEFENETTCIDCWNN